MSLELFFLIWLLIVIAIVLSCAKDLIVLDYTLRRSTKISKEMMNDVFGDDSWDEEMEEVPGLKDHTKN